MNEQKFSTILTHVERVVLLARRENIPTYELSSHRHIELYQEEIEELRTRVQEYAILLAWSRDLHKRVRLGLRDKIAMQCIPADGENVSDRAARAYAMADAMMQERGSS